MTVIYMCPSNVGMRISVGYLLRTIGRKITKTRSHFPSVSFDLIKIGCTLSKGGIFLSIL